jgi:beta-RFAP synthase
MILEGLVTTVSGAGQVNLAPMGPIVDDEMSTLVLRPFQSSTTLANLLEHPEGVFHVTDDVLLLARAAIGTVDPLPELFSAREVSGQVVAGACRWYEFRIEEADTSTERTRLTARIVHSGRIRDYFGLHRARHAVLEAAILATRVHILPLSEVRRQFAELAVVVDKTAGPTERQAFGLLEDYLEQALTRPASFSVSTGSRLHFGLLACGDIRPGGVRQFGGAGMMIDDPGVTLQAVSDQGDGVVIDPEFESSVVAAADIERVVGWLADVRGSETHLGGCRIEIRGTIPAHSGLGSGTQLALATARAAAGLWDMPSTSVELAGRVGRGLRSGIGIHGFEHGGFLVDAGSRKESEIAPLVSRVDVPSGWRIVLAGPESGEGVSGAVEREAFACLGGMSEVTTGELTRLLFQSVLPGLCEADIEETGEGLYEFGRLVGESFASVQGGSYWNPQMSSLVEWARGAGIRGVGQSSWGPTIWMLVPDAGVAESLSADVAVRSGVGWCRVVRPLNCGAESRPMPSQPRRTLSNSG